MDFRSGISRVRIHDLFASPSKYVDLNWNRSYIMPHLVATMVRTDRDDSEAGTYYALSVVGCGKLAAGSETLKEEYAHAAAGEIHCAILT